MIRIRNGLFCLDTPGTSYLIGLSKSGHPLHLYLGPRLKDLGDMCAYVNETELRMPTLVNYADQYPRQYMTLLPLETSQPGKGDLRECMFRGELGESGQNVFDFTYESHRVVTGDTRGLFPGPRRAGSETLELCLLDRCTGLRLLLFYTVYEDSDVIVRRARIENASNETLTVRALYSLQLDVTGEEWDITTLDGAWARERHVHRQHLCSGQFAVQSRAGISSAEHNPFLLAEDGDGAIGLGLIWSGDHREAAEADYGMLRLLCGLCPDTFSWQLRPGEGLDSPEAALVWGRDQAEVTGRLHGFITEKILPSHWAHRVRPVVLNSWEGLGLDVSEEKILEQAQIGRDLGCELMVIDDGWFRAGLEARGGLGDWRADRRKFPRGLGPVCQGVHDLGMLCGIWVEPEMISMESDLYRAHPELLVRCPGRDPSPARDQYLIDMTNPKAVDGLFEALSAVISEGFDYVKWDMNRYLSDGYGAGLWTPEYSVRWTLGTYSLLRRIRERFPELLLEGCASGGSRYDLGMLCFCDQIWASDNTDASDRADILLGTCLAYPQRTVGAHRSKSPCGITGREVHEDTGFLVNAFGAFGLELDVTALPRKARETITAQLTLYKALRPLFQLGQWHALEEDGHLLFSVVDPESGAIVAVCLDRRQTLSRQRVPRLHLPWARDDLYRVERLDTLGNSLFSRRVPGALLRHGGMAVPFGFTGTELNDKTLMGDYRTRLYRLCPVRERKEQE